MKLNRRCFPQFHICCIALSQALNSQLMSSVNREQAHRLKSTLLKLSDGHLAFPVYTKAKDHIDQSVCQLLSHASSYCQVWFRENEKKVIRGNFAALPQVILSERGLPCQFVQLVNIASCLIWFRSITKNVKWKQLTRGGQISIWLRLEKPLVTFSCCSCLRTWELFLYAKGQNAAYNFTRFMTPHMLSIRLKAEPMARSTSTSLNSLFFHSELFFHSIALHRVPSEPQTFIESRLCQTDKCWPNSHFDFSSILISTCSWGTNSSLCPPKALLCSPDSHHVCQFNVWREKGRTEKKGFLMPLPLIRKRR